MRQIILCADDFAKNSAISQGIIQLAAKQRISATSCMTNMPGWLLQAKLLEPYFDQIDIGLHFNLTDSNKELLQLLLATNLHLVKRHKIATEFNKQIDLFIKGTHRMPDFIDGHQHIHQLPIINDIILDIYHKRFPDRKPYFRYVKALNSLKGFIITFCSDYGFKNKLNKYKINYNTSFSGIYNLNHSANYAKIFPGFLREISDGGLIMCHPGLEGQRHYELDYLLSNQFTDVCYAAAVKISRMTSIVNKSAISGVTQ